MHPPLYHIVAEESAQDEQDTSSVESSATEGSDSDWIEAGNKKWSEEDLMDDARPGRRKGGGRESLS
jgi:hypothetical protein